MDYAGFLLRRERLERNWSQEGLCKGICTVSYLSKIEQGKAEPSPELLTALMAQMGLVWHDADREMSDFIEGAWEALMSLDKNIADMVKNADEGKYLLSALGPDLMLLQRIALNRREPIDAELEPCLSNRLLAFQRMLQKRFEDAVRLFPCAWLYTMAGQDLYENGDIPAALEALQKGYQLASDEGYPRVMLLSQLLMGNCYSNRHDIPAMQNHYRIARRLAQALNDASSLEAIDYNIASTQLEAGEYEKALAYFSCLDQPSRMDLHKLAICYEKLGLQRESMDALSRAYRTEPFAWMPVDLDTRMLDLIKYRLTHPEYLKDETYGKMLSDTFDKMQKYLPFGYAAFHLNWMLEWYESNRQYRQAYQLMRDFPVSEKNKLFKA